MRSGLRFFPGCLPETLNKHRRVPGTAVREPNINSVSGCQNTRLDADFLVSRQEMAHIPAPDSLDGQSVVHMLSRADDLCQSFTFFFFSRPSHGCHFFPPFLFARVLSDC